MVIRREMYERRSVPKGVIGNSLCLRKGEIDVKKRKTINCKMNDKEKCSDLNFIKLLSENVVNLRQTFESQNQLLLVEDVMNEKNCKKMAKELNKIRPYVHRMSVSKERQAGSVNSATLSKSRLLSQLCQPSGLQRFIETITEEKYITIKAENVSVDFYGEGDFNNVDSLANAWVLLFGLKNTTVVKIQEGEDEQTFKLNAGSILFFDGHDRKYSIPSEINTGERCVLSMWANRNDTKIISRELSEQVTMTVNENISSPTVVAFVNKLSGGQRGKEVIRKLRAIIGEANVFDLNECNGPEQGLKKFKAVNNLRVIACGGDGTIRWVIQGLTNLQFDPLPPVGVIPIGTGNDMSRMFGWGPGYNGEDLQPIVDNLMKATMKPMDLWKVTMTPWNPDTNRTKDEQANTQIMFNYFNIGYDAQVANGFHSLRCRKPWLFPARKVNEMWYFYFAFHSAFQGVKALQEHSKLYIDDKLIEIPSHVRTLVVLNFVCYQSGTDIWGEDEEEGGPKMDDQQVEIIGIGAYYHEALIRLNLSPGTRLGRGKKVKLAITKPVDFAIAFDGEPMVQECSVITIQHGGQVQVLQNPTNTTGLGDL